MNSVTAWSPPQYDMSRPPSLKTSVEPSRRGDLNENFARVAKWCPDGSSLLAQCEDRSLQSFDTPYSYPTDSSSPDRVYTQPAPILDFLWYPSASPINPASYCLVCSVRECPVKLLDASDGRLRASYRIVDHRERQIAPHCLAFNLTAERLYCGFEDAVEVFDVACPGEGTRLPTTPSKKSKDGLKGIVSALAFMPSQGSDMYAAGSLSPTSANIALFSEAQGTEPIMFVSGGPSSGVTQLHFNPARPHIMYAAYRRHGAIYSWDLRTNVDVPLKVYKFKDPSGRTNQKLRFDVDLGGNWLASGDQHGNVSVFNVYESDALQEFGDNQQSNDSEEVYPVLEFGAHQDAIGSVAFHPFQPTLATVSGSRHFQSDSSSDSSDSDDDLPHPGAVIRRRRPHPVTLDSTIKTWTFDYLGGQMTAQDQVQHSDNIVLHPSSSH